MDTCAPKPSQSPDEQFHRIITELLEGGPPRGGASGRLPPPVLFLYMPADLSTHLLDPSNDEIARRFGAVEEP